MVLDPYDSRINTISQVLGRYLRMRTSFFLSYLSGSLTIVVMNVIPVSILVRAFFSKTGAWPWWYGKYVHLILWDFVSSWSPQISGWRTASLLYLCVFTKCLPGNFTGIISCIFLPCPACVSPTAVVSLFSDYFHIFLYLPIICYIFMGRDVWELKSFILSVHLSWIIILLSAWNRRWWIYTLLFLGGVLTCQYKVLWGYDSCSHFIIK